MRFRGETCDVDPAKEAELIRCINRFRDRYHRNPGAGRGNAADCGCSRNTVAALAALGLVFLAWRLASGTRQRRLR